MDIFFNELLANTSADLSFFQSLITMAVALVLGGIIAFTYYKTQSEEYYQRSLAITLCMLPIILSVIILFIGSNIARAFSLAGTLSIIRFRSAPGDAKDIGFIFFDITAGLACGVGLYGYGALFVIVLCAVIFLLETFKAFEKKTTNKTLKILIPEDLNFEGAFDDVLEFDVLEYLMQNKDIVLSREKIESHIWNFDYSGGSNVIDVYIRYLRKKIDDAHEKKLIHTIRGAGYVLRIEP